jgi:hypothetical protein
MSLLNNYLLNAGKPQLGFPNVLLYNMATAQPNTFNHVTSGANKCTEQVSLRCPISMLQLSLSLSM